MTGPAAVGSTTGCAAAAPGSPESAASAATASPAATPSAAAPKPTSRHERRPSSNWKIKLIFDLSPKSCYSIWTPVLLLVDDQSTALCPVIVGVNPSCQTKEEAINREPHHPSRSHRPLRAGARDENERRNGRNGTNIGSVPCKCELDSSENDVTAKWLNCAHYLQSRNRATMRIALYLSASGEQQWICERNTIPFLINLQCQWVAVLTTWPSIVSCSSQSIRCALASTDCSGSSSRVRDRVGGRSSSSLSHCKDNFSLPFVG